MLLLAFDTATPAVTTALCEPDSDGVRVRAARTTVDARRHGELLVPQIRSVVAEAGAVLGDVTHIAVGIGPGPYTGLRVGLATAHALAEALGVPCVGVATLDALGVGIGSEHVVHRRHRCPPQRSVLGALHRRGYPCWGHRCEPAR